MSYSPSYLIADFKIGKFSHSFISPFSCLSRQLYIALTHRSRLKREKGTRIVSKLCQMSNAPVCIDTEDKPVRWEHLSITKRTVKYSSLWEWHHHHPYYKKEMYKQFPLETRNIPNPFWSLSQKSKFLINCTGNYVAVVKWIGIFIIGSYFCCSFCWTGSFLLGKNYAIFSRATFTDVHLKCKELCQTNATIL